MLANNVSHCKTITLWTCQSKIVADSISENGIYHVKKEYIQNKYEEVSRVFFEAYNWFVISAQKIVPKPVGAEYPVWLFTDLRYVYCNKGDYIIKVEAAPEDVILIDYEKWNRILNLSYVPKDHDDDTAYKYFLEKQGIYNETDIFMKSYYPSLKAKVKKSWDRVFDNSSILSNVQQAALWEIKKEWVTEVREV